MSTLISRFLTAIALLLCVTQTWAATDPSTQVGRISYLEGEVTFSELASGDSGPALLNWPVTSNTMISTASRSRAEINVGSTLIQLDADSELEITQLDDEHLIVRLNHGAAIASVRSSVLASGFEFDTPQGRVLLSAPARFRVAAGYAPDSSLVAVFSGRVRFEGSDSTLTVAAGREAEIAGGQISVAGIDNDRSDDQFDAWSVARDQRSERSTSIRYVSAETTGYQELDHYGDWQVTTEYGALWQPRVVAADWAPYRVGRWTWVEPWGWTWVDSAPWGYAPSHYGRWVMYRQRWCWSPGAVVARPVWAPALVGWVGGNHWSASVSIGAAPSVGWFPLAPREIYVPGYRASPTYVRQVNYNTNITNISRITYVNGMPDLQGRPEYRNRSLRQAVTIMPSDSFHNRRAVVVTHDSSPRQGYSGWKDVRASAVPPAAIRQPATFSERGTRQPRTESPVRMSAQRTWSNTNPSISPLNSSPTPSSMSRPSRNERPTFPATNEEMRRPESRGMPQQNQPRDEVRMPRPVQTVKQPTGLIAPPHIRERQLPTPSDGHGTQYRSAPSGGASLAIPPETHSNMQRERNEHNRRASRFEDENR